ncbi:hypothetical protein CRYUN_Cryun07bG0104000 [Craigia yunnanensis]
METTADPSSEIPINAPDSSIVPPNSDHDLLAQLESLRQSYNALQSKSSSMEENLRLLQQQRYEAVGQSTKLTEKVHELSLERDFLRHQIEEFEIAERGLHRVGFGFMMGSGSNKQAMHSSGASTTGTKSDSSECEEEVVSLVEELLMEIKETESEFARWREACELEVEAGKKEVEERDKVVVILKQELEKTKAALEISNGKLKLKEELAAAAMAAQAAKLTAELQDFASGLRS